MELDLRSQIERLEQSDKLSPELKAQFERAYQEIGQSVISEAVPKAGGQAPDFTLPNAVGIPVALADALMHGPAVVTFYRGIW